MHLGRLVGLLATHLTLSSLRSSTHAEVDHLYLQITSDICQEDVLERQVTVCDAKLMQPLDCREYLNHQGLHFCLSCHSWRWIEVTPTEEVAACRKLCHHVGVLSVTEDAHEFTDVGEAQSVELSHDGDVAPRPLRGRGVLLVKLLGTTGHPAAGHALHGHTSVTVGATSTHLVYTSLVPNGILQLAHEPEHTGVPGLYRSRHCYHAPLQLLVPKAPHVVRTARSG
mmetsp:Transcript_15573/g.21002  ORF Transcript_15573/g.21002 Transcript_15573/m.21002 type:complete len:226 (+) Transcript_15573:510-1187(+)